jgi:hypothetical protein
VIGLLVYGIALLSSDGVLLYWLLICVGWILQLLNFVMM